MATAKPPADLVRRVGYAIQARSPKDRRGLHEVHDERGRESWELLRSLLPPSWDFTGKRALDFGCGIGRMLLNGPARERTGEFWGCDIDAASIDWLERNASPPLHVFRCPVVPPLPIEDGYFDLIYAWSVFTHLTDSWSAWLAELHRVLAPDGLLVATVFGPGHSDFGGIPLGEDVVGMNVYAPYTPWSGGGPLIFHAEWWLRAHWGRAFEILELRPGDPSGAPPLYGQGVVLMRPRPVSLTAVELEPPEPSEPREFTALRNNIASLSFELERHTVYLTSRSWRMTAPLRGAVRRLRRRFRR